MADHPQLTDESIHTITARTYADIAERDADNDFDHHLTSVNKVVRVNTDPITYYILSINGNESIPQDPVWQELTLTDIPTFNKLTVNGNITVTGTVDGRDVSDDGDQLDQNTTDVGLNNTHRTSDGKDHSDVVLNNTHRVSDGKDHSDVVLNNAHRVSDGKDHSDVVLNNTHRTSDGKDHSDVVLNNTHRTSDGSDHSWLNQAVTTTSNVAFSRIIIDNKMSFDSNLISGISGNDLNLLTVGASSTINLSPENNVVNINDQISINNIGTGSNPVLSSNDAAQVLNVAGSITLDGTVDGIDIATDVAANTAHRGSDGKDHSDVVLNNAHRISDGSDHSFIDQDVTLTASPQFATLGIGTVAPSDGGDILVAGNTTALQLRNTGTGTTSLKFTKSGTNSIGLIQSTGSTNTLSIFAQQGNLDLGGASATAQLRINNGNISIINQGAGSDPVFFSNNVGQVLSLTGDLVISGDLTIQGTTTTLDTTTLIVEDKNIELGNVATPTDITADGGGITLLGDTNKTIVWLNSIDAWQLNQNLDVQGSIDLTGLVDGRDVAADGTQIDLNTTHKSSDGTDHTFIDQDVTTTAIPRFDRLSLGTSAPASDASLDLQATDEAFMVNRGTTAEKNAITALESMQFYDTDLKDLQFYDGVSWVTMGGGDVSGDVSSTDNALVRFDGVSGKNIQNSGVIISDEDVLSGMTKLIQKPAAPVVIETETRFEFGQSRGVFIQGNYAYVPAIDQDILNIIDITKPTQIEAVGSVSSALYSNVQAIHVIGDYAYTAGNSRFSVTDVSDTSNPVIVSSFGGADFDTSTKGLYASGDYVYIISPVNSKLSIIDVSDPTVPFVAGSFVDAVNMIEAQGVYVVGKYAYVTTGTENGLQIIDVSDPTTPVRVGGHVDAVNMAFTAKAVIQGNYAYVACTTSDNIEIINISNPASPVSVGRVTDSTFLNQIIDIKVFGDYAYTVSNHGTAAYFTIVDVSNPQNPVVIESLLIGQSLGFDISGNIALITEQSTQSIRVVSLGGTDVASMSAGELKVGELNILQNIQVGQDVDVKRNIHVGGTAIVNDPVSSRSALNKRTGLGGLVEPVKTGAFDIPATFVANTLYKLVDAYTDALEHIIPVGSNSAFESTSIDVNTYVWTGGATDLLLDGSAGVLSFAQDKTIIVSSNGGQYMNILGSGSGFFVIKGGSEVDFFDKVGVIKDHSFNVRGAGFINDQEGITMINCRSNWTSFGYIAFADHGQTMMDIALGVNPVSVRGGDISLFAGDTAFLIHNGAPASARLIIESNNFGEFTGTAFGSNTTGVTAMAATSPVGGTLVTPATGARVWDGDTLIGANFTSDTQYNVGGMLVSNTILNEDGTAGSYEIDILFDGSEDLTGDFTMVGLDQKDPRILSVNNSGVFPVSRTIGSYIVDDNGAETTFAGSDIWTDFNLGGNAIAGTDIESFQLTDATTGELIYIGIEPFSGNISYEAYASSAGGAVIFNFRAVKNGSPLPDLYEPPIEIGSDTSHVRVSVPVTLVTGDTITPQVNRASGTSSISFSHVSMNIQ